MIPIDSAVPSPMPSRTNSNKGTTSGVPQVRVTQLGARRRYLVPVTFQNSGMLADFYTDFYLSGWPAKLLGWASRTFSLGILRRLVARWDAGLPGNKIHCYPGFTLKARWRTKRLRKAGELTKAWIESGKDFASRVAKQPLNGVDAVYAYSSAALELFQEAKQQGKLCILDHATAPKRYEDALTAQQAERYPGWSSAPPAEDRWVDEYSNRQNEEAQLADLIICGSTFVQNAVEAACGMGHKCVIVPLGLRKLPSDVVTKSSTPRNKLHVLFVGDDAIRKGIGDLCAAVSIFGTHRCEARVAGQVDLSEHGRTLASQSVTLLGSVPYSDMLELYRWADVCVLPSVSDTFALVVLEALSMGVPVITTPNTGASDTIQDEKNGFIVPIMSPEQIVEKLLLIHEDRSKLESMSRQAILTVQNYGPDQYARRLTDVVLKACEAK